MVELVGMEIMGLGREMERMWEGNLRQGKGRGRGAWEVVVVVEFGELINRVVRSSYLRRHPSFVAIRYV